MNPIQLSLSYEELAAVMAAVQRSDDALMLLRAAGAAEPEAARQRLVAAGNGLLARGLAANSGDQVQIGPALREIIAAITGATAVIRMSKTGAEDADTLTLSATPEGWLSQRSGGRWGVHCQMPVASAELPALMVQFLAPTARTEAGEPLTIPAALINLDAKQRRIPAALWGVLGDQARSNPLAGKFVQSMAQARWRAAFQAFFPSGKADISGYGVFFVQGPDDLWIIEEQPSGGEECITARQIGVTALKERFEQRVNALLHPAV